MAFDPFDWARWQLELDARENGRFPEMLARKSEKLVASPFAFFRGTAPLFYSVLAEAPQLVGGAGDTGFVVGDAHLENFGAFRVGESNSEKSEVVFCANDFDEAGVAPLAVDPIRLGASLLLAARELRVSGAEAASLLETSIESYARRASGDAATDKPPECVRKHLERVEKRTKREFLEKRTRVEGSERRFVRGDRYADLRASWTEALEEALPRYVESILPPDTFPIEARDFEDAAFRIAGTGSLGCVRLATLHRGKGGEEGKWLFDWKEERVPALGAFASQTGEESRGRVLRGIRRFLPRAPRMLGQVEIAFEGVGAKNYVVRRLAPQEDKLDLRTLEARELPGLVSFLGNELASLHLRANPGLEFRADASTRTTLVESATAVAGVFEAIFLAYCCRRRRGLPK